MHRFSHKVIIISKNLDDFSLTNHGRFAKFAKLFPAKLSRYMVYGKHSIIAGSWTSKLLKPLGVELPLTVMKVDVAYWQATDHPNICTATTAAGDNHSNRSMGVFILWDDIHFYGLPSYEYPGLIKVCIVY